MECFFRGDDEPDSSRLFDRRRRSWQALTPVIQSPLWMGLFFHFCILLQRSDAQAATQNLGWLVAKRLTWLVFTVLDGFAVARYLSLTQFGSMDYAGVLVCLVMVFAQMGLEPVTKCEISQTSASERAESAAALGLAGSAIQQEATIC